MNRILIGVIKLYRYLVSPLFGPCCRFHPSCSAYAVEAIARHGAVRGGAISLWRLARCNPWHPGGFDPVPDAHQYRHG